MARPYKGRGANNRPAIITVDKEVQSFNLAKMISRKMPISRREYNL